MRHRLLVTALAWLALAGSALATELVAAPTVPVRLAAPAPGAVLQAGGTAEIAWEPLADFVRLGPVEEWEAFLSLDGGKTYPVRITPHLDRDLRRVRWRVPPVPAADARLLLRFGNEGRETYFELPQRFAIAAAPTLDRSFAEATVAAAPGEPARPGAAGVVAWVEGSRRGARLRQVVAPERPAFAARVQHPTSHAEPAVLASEESPGGPPQALSAGRGRAAPPALRTTAARGLSTASLCSISILLLTQRRNE